MPTKKKEPAPKDAVKEPIKEEPEQEEPKQEAQEKSASAPDMYPVIAISRNQNPNKLYAIPIVGFLVKVIILIPLFIELFFLGLFCITLSIVNSFNVLFNGTYMDFAYRYLAGILRLNAKLHFFMFGLTDKYPGFDFDIHDSFTMEIQKPKNPSRFFAIPVLGGLARIMLLIPYLIYSRVLQYAAWFGAIGASVPVLLQGKYPESSHELARDYVRVNLASAMYVVGLSDRYPSFWISMNHKNIKIALIVLAVLYILASNLSQAFNKDKDHQKTYRHEYPNMRNTEPRVPSYESKSYGPSD